MESDKLLAARIGDALRLSELTGSFKTVGFLSESEKAEAQKLALGIGGKFCFFGGFNGAERAVFFALPDWCDNPQELDIISSLTLSFPQSYTLSHRDFLGALMSLGITRQTVGDILVESGRAVVFLLSDIVPTVVYGLSKVGNVGVSVSAGFCEPLPGLSNCTEVSFTVASARLDSVIADLLGTSREKAKLILNDGLVSLNGFTVTKPTRTILVGDRITIRGKGRFDLVSDCGVTKKGRTVLRFNKYI